MKVGELAEMLGHCNSDDDIVVVVTPDLIENEVGEVKGPIDFDIDRITVIVRPARESGFYAATSRVVLALRP